MSGSNLLASIENPEVWKSLEECKRSVTEKLTNCEKSRSRYDTGNARIRNDVINLGIQHADEHCIDQVSGSFAYFEILG